MSCLLQRFFTPTLWLICSCLFPLTLFAQPPKATGSVAGRITDGEKPIPGITVTARDSTVNSSGQSDLRGRAVTDSDGRYRIEALPAGRYGIMPQHALYVVNQTAASRQAPGAGVNLAAGESVENTDFTLTKGGVIAGRITDYDGKPAIEQQVGLLRLQPNGKWQQANPFNNYRMRNTDDRGDYRLYGLEPGQYKVFVGRAADDRSFGVGSGNNFRRRVYYPNAMDEVTAEAVIVKAGVVAEGIDIRLQGLFKTFDVTARVIDAQTGQPVAGVVCGYGRWNAAAKGTGGYAIGPVTAANGEALFQGIAPGTYAAFVNDSGDAYSEYAVFEVTEHEAPNVEIKLQHGKTVSGQIVLLGANEAAMQALFRQTKFSVYASASSGIGPTGREFTSNANHSFTVKGVPSGEVYFNVIDNGRDKDFSIIAVEHQGVKTYRHLTMPAVSHLTDVKLYVLARGQSVLRGQLQLVNGAMPDTASFSIRLFAKNVPVLSGLLTPTNDFAGIARVDQRGNFEFAGLHPGEYELRTELWSMTIKTDASGSLTVPPVLPAIKQIVQINEGSNQVTVRVDFNAARKEGQ
jgi:Carboxypeptidase regulatory-like domain